MTHSGNSDSLKLWHVIHEPGPGPMRDAMRQLGTVYDAAFYVLADNELEAAEAARDRMGADYHDCILVEQ